MQQAINQYKSDSADYQVEAIPAKFIIDKNGDIACMGESSNIELEIENAKNRWQSFTGLLRAAYGIFVV